MRTIFFIFLNNREPELEPAPRRAKKYRLRNNFLSRAEFFLIMRNLPELVPDSDIQQMFEYADTDKIFTTPDDERTENYVTGRFG